MAPYKNVHPTILRDRERRLIAQMQHLGHISYDRTKLHGDAQCALADLFVSIGADLRAVRAELRVRDRMIPTAIAS